MRVSTKGDYAARAMQDLALQYDKGPIQIEEIARRQHLPARYLEQILLSLKRAGFVESKRGVSGGYYLAKHPREITIVNSGDTILNCDPAREENDPHKKGINRRADGC